MEQAAVLETTPASDQEYEELSGQYLNRIQNLQQSMDQDRREIEAIRQETDAIIADIMRRLPAPKSEDAE